MPSARGMLLAIASGPVGPFALTTVATTAGAAGLVPWPCSLGERLGPTGIVGSVLILAAVAGLDEQDRPEEPGRSDSGRRTVPQA